MARMEPDTRRKGVRGRRHSLDAPALRELMSGGHSFNDIHRGVTLFSRALLVTRLRDLETYGIIERRSRRDAPLTTIRLFFPTELHMESLCEVGLCCSPIVFRERP